MNFDDDVLKAMTQMWGLSETRARAMLEDLHDAGFEVVPLADTEAAQ